MVNLCLHECNHEQVRFIGEEGSKQLGSDLVVKGVVVNAVEQRRVCLADNVNRNGGDVHDERVCDACGRVNR
jgi:hypothetical protein